MLTLVHRSLLVTLGIYKALATECKNDVGLLTPSLLAAVDATLATVPNDLEIAAKTATVVRPTVASRVPARLTLYPQFTAWATFTDGNLVGPNGNLAPTYLSCLRHFARLSVVEATSTDGELRNRHVNARP